MTYEESAIINFLEGSPDVFVSRREIARKALKRRIFEENPNWVDAPLSSLLGHQLIEQNDSAQFRMRKSDVLP